MKNRIIYWLLSQTVCLSLFSANPVPDRNNQGKWGYVDDSDNLVIDYTYDDAAMFNNGVAIVRKGNRCGLISPSGEEVVAPKYNSITPAGVNVYRVSASGKLKDGVWIDEKYGFISKSGEELLPPVYDEIGIFTDGVAYVKKGDLYGYINSDINIIVPVKYKAVGKFNSAGIVWVNDGGKFKKETPSVIKGGKFGIYNKSGQEVVPVKYKSVGVFSPYKQKLNENKLKNMSLQERTVNKESGSHRLLTKVVQNTSLFSKIDEDASGLWASSKDDGSKNAVISPDGNIIIPAGLYHQAYYPEEGIALVKPKNPFTTSYVELQSGRVITETSGGWAFQDGVAVVRTNAQMCLIDKQGQKCSKEYQEIYPRKDSVYIVRDGKKFGMIDFSGREIIAPEENILLFPPSHGLMLHSKGDMIGFINQNGEWVIKPKYSRAYSFECGLASVKSHNGKWGEIDRTGKEVVPVIWGNTINKSVEGQRYIWVSRQNDDKYMPFDVVEGRLAFENRTFAWCRNFGSDFEGVARAGQDDNHVGIVNLKGEMIIPEVFTSAEAYEAYEQFLKTGKPWTDVDTYRLKLLHNKERNNKNIHQNIAPDLWDY